MTLSMFGKCWVFTRKAKNKYTWKGFGTIPKALQDLKVNSKFFFCIFFCKFKVHDLPEGHDHIIFTATVTIVVLTVWLKNLTFRLARYCLKYTEKQFPNLSFVSAKFVYILNAYCLDLRAVVINTPQFDLS